MASGGGRASQGSPRREFRVAIFQEEDGTVPLLEWFASLNSPKALARCQAAIELLRQHGNRLFRPHAEALRDHIRELRAKVGHVQYRMLYFFHARGGAVLTHGFIKKGSKVPAGEIDKAIEFRKRFLADPARHTYVENFE